MSKVEFYYFPLKGRGESCRMLLAYGGQEYEDIRVPMEQWPDYKPKMKYGHMPVLVKDGKQYSQSSPICRYLGRQYGLAGNDEEEDFEIDEIADFIEDLTAKTMIYYEKEEVAKEKKYEEYKKNVFPPLLEKLSDAIEKNDGHFAIGRLTWADFYFIGLFDWFKLALRKPDLLTKYPNFGKVLNNVLSIPKVKAYVDTTPETHH